MGIQGLLPLLKTIHKPTKLDKFFGKTLAVDAYGWLHRGAIACAVELAEGKPTRKFVDYAMHRVRMLKHFGVTPYIVFDGDFLPSKALTEASRATRREESRKLGMELLKAGRPTQAYQVLQKAIDITPEMARQFIEELKKAKVPYVVAPYEADAQMVYLERKGLVDGIISEDSDLLVFGAKRLLTKLGNHGECVEINRQEFGRVREINLTGWTDEEFRYMAILSGCDYIESIKSMGLKTAHRMVRKHKTPENIIRTLQFSASHKVSENYLAAFKQADLTFQYQRVFCPDKQELVLLSTPPPGLDVENMPFIGAQVDPEMARAVAVGDVNPITKETIVVAPTPGTNRGTRAAGGRTQDRPFGKPIEHFFNRGRKPLGEMEPNAFVVNPEQVAALTQNGLLPRVFPLPRPYIDTPPSTRPSTVRPGQNVSQSQRRRTEPLADVLNGVVGSVAAPRRRTTGSDLDSIAASDKDNFRRPAKKARLCDEASIIGEKPDTPAPGRSKYFSPVTQGKAAQKQEHGALIMSDDSIEDALLALPDLDSWQDSARSQGSSKSLNVFHDDSQLSVDDTQLTIPDSSPLPRDQSFKIDDSQTIPSSPTTRRQSGIPQETPASRSSLSRFTFKPKDTQQRPGTKVVHGLPTPASSTQGSISRFSNLPITAASGDQGFKSKFSGLPGPPTPMMTPLQRIGAQAMTRGRAGGVTASPRQPLADRRVSMQTLFPVNPAFVPLPKVDLKEVEALNRMECGSEDQIIPDSDGENEPADADEEDKTFGKIPTRLNLSHFVF